MYTELATDAHSNSLQPHVHVCNLTYLRMTKKTKTKTATIFLCVQIL